MLKHLWTISTGTLLASAPAWATDPLKVDVELVLAADVSTSVGPNERDVQRLGYIDAFRDPAVVAAMLAGRRQRIAVTYVEWADAGFQRVVVPWMLIDTPQSARQFADILQASGIERRGATSISAALVFSATLFADNGYIGERQLIDISGDGTNNDGEPVDLTSQKLASLAITINALPLYSADADISPEDLTQYYHDCVRAGYGSFTHPAVTYAEFGPSIKRKLIAEISGTPPALVWRASAQTDCLHGERKLRNDYIQQLNEITNGRSKRWMPDEDTWPSPD
jgi:hypothetical protein